MDFDKLKTFYQVALAGGISEAVNSLDMDKSTISRQLSLLEAQVGTKLFSRQKNQLILTPQGEYLFKKAGNILMEIEAIKETIASDQQQNRTRKQFCFRIHGWWRGGLQAWTAGRFAGSG